MSSYSVYSPQTFTVPLRVLIYITHDEVVSVNIYPCITLILISMRILLEINYTKLPREKQSIMCISTNSRTR